MSGNAPRLRPSKVDEIYAIAGDKQRRYYDAINDRTISKRQYDKMRRGGISNEKYAKIRKQEREKKQGPTRGPVGPIQQPPVQVDPYQQLINLMRSAKEKPGKDKYKAIKKWIDDYGDNYPDIDYDELYDLL